jgi:hypothetical protein
MEFLKYNFVEVSGHNLKFLGLEVSIPPFLPFNNMLFMNKLEFLLGIEVSIPLFLPYYNMLFMNKLEFLHLFIVLQRVLKP